MDTVILIPAYRPDDVLTGIAKRLSGMGYDILVVDDGSGRDYADVFLRVGEYARVVGYDVNKGKGIALKYGIAFIKQNYPECRFFITADADGQHSIDDICRVDGFLHERGGMVLGSRVFEGRIPLRSRVGNDLSRFSYTVSTGMYLRDNQSGLRGFDISLADMLLKVGGERYEYEINVLMYAARYGVDMFEMPMKTIYEEGNKSSHFRPIPDTLRIHGRILCSSWASLIAIALNIALVAAFGYLFMRYVFDIELSVLSAGAFAIALRFFLGLFDPAYIARRSLFLLRAIPRLLLQLAFAEFFFRIARIGMTGAYISSMFISCAIEYIALKTLSRIPQKAEKGAFHEAV